MPQSGKVPTVRTRFTLWRGLVVSWTDFDARCRQQGLFDGAGPNHRHSTNLIAEALK